MRAAPDPGAWRHARPIGLAQSAPEPLPRAARRGPDQPAGLGLHADLPDPLPGPGVPLQPHVRHRHRDHRAHDHHPDPAHPGVPGADRVAAADADAPAGAARDPDQVQGQPREDLRRADEALPGARREPGVRMPAGGPAAGPAAADVPGVQPGPERSRHQLDADRRRRDRREHHVRDTAEPVRIRASTRTSRGWPGCPRSSTASFQFPGYPGGLPANLPEIFLERPAGSVRAVAAGARVGDPPAHPDADDGDAVG